MPKIEILDEKMFLALKVAKEGYFSGNPESVLYAPVQIVLSVLKYESLMSDYLEAFRTLNEEKN